MLHETHEGEGGQGQGYKFTMPALTRHELAEKVGKCFNTTKYVLFFGLLLVFVLGLAVFCVGVSGAVSEKALSSLRIPGIASLPIWMIILGIFVCLVTIIGALGAQLFNRPLLITFSVLLGVLLVMQFSVGIAAGVEHSKLPSLMSVAWDKAENSTRGYLETQFRCCGYYNTSDRAWLEGCPPVVVTNASAVPGCKDAMFEKAAKLVYAVGSAGIAVTLLEILALGITIAFIVRIRNIQLKYSQVSQDDPVALLQ